ncbi:MAG: CPBP family intramembrane metalloprotease [Chloroflexi bacterium]|nr:CPBP family intramembrane metalloprotease [Chloroflexota bacterium]
MNSLQILAWGGTLLFSILPNVLFQEITGNVPEWLFGAKLAILAVFLLLSLFWGPARKLQRYFLVFLAILLTARGWQAVAESTQWRTWFPSDGTGFLFQMFSIQLGRLAIAFSMIAALFLIGFRRKEFFLDFGDLYAPASPLPLVGVNKPTNWRSLGLRLSAYIFFAILITLLWSFGGSLKIDILATALPALPMVLLLAGMNSLSDEITYRAALLAPTHRILGAGQAVWLAAIFFGIGHYYDYGIIGALITSLFGWILGCSMVETKGLFWPWFLHFVAALVIFSFMAVGALQIRGV